jgi:hypothetical protein
MKGKSPRSFAPFIGSHSRYDDEKTKEISHAILNDPKYATVCDPLLVQEDMSGELWTLPLESVLGVVLFL